MEILLNLCKFLYTSPYIISDFIHVSDFFIDYYFTLFYNDINNVIWPERVGFPTRLCMNGHTGGIQEDRHGS